MSAAAQSSILPGALPGPHERRRPRPVLVIDGEATLVSRKASPRDAAPAAPDVETTVAEALFDAAPAMADGAFVAKLRSEAANQWSSSPDLVFQNAGRHAEGRGARTLVRGAPLRRGLAIFTDAPRGTKARRDRRVAGCAAILALLSLPILFLSAPIAPVEATPGLAAPLVQPLVIDQLVTSIVPRGTGAVLTVDGRIRNSSSGTVAVPPVKIALVRADGTQTSKALMPGVPTLQAGRSVRFHSTVAVAKDSKGAIKVGFPTPPVPSGKTPIE